MLYRRSRSRVPIVSRTPHRHHECVDGGAGSGLSPKDRPCAIRRVVDQTRELVIPPIWRRVDPPPGSRHQRPHGRGRWPWLSRCICPASPSVVGGSQARMPCPRRRRAFAQPVSGRRTVPLFLSCTVTAAHLLFLSAPGGSRSGSLLHPFFPLAAGDADPDHVVRCVRHWFVPFSSSRAAPSTCGGSGRRRAKAAGSRASTSPRAGRAPGSVRGNG